MLARHALRRTAQARGIIAQTNVSAVIRFEVEWHDSGLAVRLRKPDACEGDLTRIVALAQAGVS